jgi:hypothetical protein
MPVPTLSQAALFSAGRFVLFAAAAAAVAAATTVLPGLHLGEPYDYVAGFALAAAAKYVEAHRRVG